MNASGPSVLVVAHRTAATPRLLEAVRRRARAGAARFTLLVPRTYWDPDTEVAAMTIELAVPLLEEAVGAPVEALIGEGDPFDAVRDTLAQGHYDEVIISMLPERISHWLRMDLPSRVERLGVPVETVFAEGRRAPAMGA
jgi:hypothetical protein